MVQSLVVRTVSTIQEDTRRNGDNVEDEAWKLSLLVSDILRREIFGIGRVATKVSMTIFRLPAAANAML